MNQSISTYLKISFSLFFFFQIFIAQAQIPPPQGITCTGTDLPTALYYEDFDQLSNPLTNAGWTGDIYPNSGTKNAFWQIGADSTGTGSTGPAEDVTGGGKLYVLRILPFDR